MQLLLQLPLPLLLELLLQPLQLLLRMPSRNAGSGTGSGAGAGAGTGAGLIFDQWYNNSDSINSSLRLCQWLNLQCFVILFTKTSQIMCFCLYLLEKHLPKTHGVSQFCDTFWHTIQKENYICTVQPCDAAGLNDSKARDFTSCPHGGEFDWLKLSNDIMESGNRLGYRLLYNLLWSMRLPPEPSPS